GAAEEERLRAHLRRCARCRARYDELSLVAEALAAAGGRRAATATGRERVRLRAALAAAPADPRPAPARARRRRLATVLLLAAPACALALLLLARPAPLGDDGVRWRGGGADPLAAAPGALLVYAARKQPDGSAGPLRLAAELPGSRE